MDIRNYFTKKRQAEGNGGTANSPAKIQKGKKMLMRSSGANIHSRF